MWSNDLPAKHINTSGTAGTVNAAGIYTTAATSAVHSAADTCVYTTDGARAIYSSCAKGAACATQNNHHLYSVQPQSEYASRTEATAERGGLLYAASESAASASPSANTAGEATASCP